MTIKLKENPYENGAVQGVGKKPAHIQSRRQESASSDEVGSDSRNVGIRLRDHVVGILNDPAGVKYYLVATGVAMTIISLFELYFFIAG